jgi:thiol-disulfide isomerase/thioredoxin
MSWVNVASLRLDKQIGRPVLVEFWDFCRAYSMRTLPYVKAWHERYAEAGLRVVGVHAGGYPPSEDPDAVREAVARLGIEHPVLIDDAFAVWKLYANKGWPARYLFDREHRLVDFHLGEGAYAETERAIQELCDAEGDAPVPALRPEDEEGATVIVPSPDEDGAWSGPYEAGGVWAVLEGSGWVRAGDAQLDIDRPGTYPLIEHEAHTTGVLELELGPGVTCHAVQFTGGVPA